MVIGQVMCKSRLNPIKKSNIEKNIFFKISDAIRRQITNREEIAKRVAKLVGLSVNWSSHVQIRSGRALSHEKVKYGKKNLFSGCRGNPEAKYKIARKFRKEWPNWSD